MGHLSEEINSFQSKTTERHQIESYTVNHYYGAQKFEFWLFEAEVINLGQEFFPGLLPYICGCFHKIQTFLYIKGLPNYGV